MTAGPVPISPTGSEAPSCMMLFPSVSSRIRCHYGSGSIARRPCRNDTAWNLQSVNDSVAVAFQRGDVIAQRFARNARVMPAAERRGQAYMRGTGLFPERDLFVPVAFGTG